eukprot:4900477-Amphidinium_carterae.2
MSDRLSHDMILTHFEVKLSLAANIEPDKLSDNPRVSTHGLYKVVRAARTSKTGKLLKRTCDFNVISRVYSWLRLGCKSEAVDEMDRKAARSLPFISRLPSSKALA